MYLINNFKINVDLLINQFFFGIDLFAELQFVLWNLN